MEGTTVCSHQTASRWMAAIWFWKERSTSRSGRDGRVTGRPGAAPGPKRLPGRSSRPGPGVSPRPGEHPHPPRPGPGPVQGPLLTLLLPFVPGDARLLHLGRDAQHHGHGQHVRDVHHEPLLQAQPSAGGVAPEALPTPPSPGHTGAGTRPRWATGRRFSQPSCKRPRPREVRHHQDVSQRAQSCPAPSTACPVPTSQHQRPPPRPSL